MFEPYAKTDGPIKVTINCWNSPIALSIADGNHFHVVMGRGVEGASQQFKNGRLYVDVPHQNRGDAGVTKVAVPPGSSVKVSTGNTYFSFDGRKLLNGQRIPEDQATPPLTLRFFPERGNGSIQNLVGSLNAKSLEASLTAHVDGPAQISTGHGLMEISGSGKRYCEVKGIHGEILLRPGDLDVHVDYLHRATVEGQDKQGRVRVAKPGQDGLLLPVGRYQVTPSGEVLEPKLFISTDRAIAALRNPGQPYSPTNTADAAQSVLDGQPVHRRPAARGQTPPENQQVLGL